MQKLWRCVETTRDSRLHLHGTRTCERELLVYAGHGAQWSRYLCLSTKRRGADDRANLVRASCDDEPFLYGVVGDRKNLFVVCLVFMGWIRPSASIPTGPENQDIDGTVDNSAPYIMSILSSPTLAKMFSFW